VNGTLENSEIFISAHNIVISWVNTLASKKKNI